MSKNRELDPKLAYLLANDGLIALDDMLAEERAKGMTGFHFTLDPTSTASSNEIAREIVKMHKSMKSGHFMVIPDIDA